MFYITGDTHRKFARIEEFCKENKTPKNRYSFITYLSI